ncbi:YkgJ family cysteine cluster protein [Thiospirochaeta perfilievii]|uniref:YkgJ family cysteine cluster protein n=2 Tax=Thiospirochaeta perfilievii TaxID=252967 RepID=A0A5C1QEB2_9SPIO|nr:YkgJ family cysteine cluster protein [Thiospirochaeta perfilievii]
MMNDFYENGLNFTCQRCSGCCRHEPGYVFLSEEDVKKMCKRLDLSRKKFIKKYCKVADLIGVKRLSLIEKPNNDCIFWDNGCTVYEARPLQCKSFPFWAHNLINEESWASVVESCPGAGQGELRSKDEIDKWLDKRLDEPFINPK